MADAQLRDIGAFVPGRDALGVREPQVAPPPRRDPPAAPPREPRSAPPLREPQVAPPPTRPQAEPTVLVTPPPPQKPVRAIFAGDRPEGQDALGIDETLHHLAELAAHGGTRGPVSVGLLGGPGTGKSFALGRLAGHVRELSVAAAKVAAGPFLPRLHVQAIDAAGLEGDPALALAARLHAGLRQPYPELAREVAATARDPHVVLRDAEEKLDETRRRLDAERRALDDASSRRARLTESVLYEASGSQVDAYARANRTSIESRLNAFGIGGDPIRNYKDLVQLVAGSGGAVGLGLRALWSFKGQLKLLVAAAVLVCVGVGLGMAIDDQASWLGQLRNAPKGGAPVADWFQTHMGLLSTIRSAAFGLAILAIAWNVLRAFIFLQPILKGSRMLQADLESRGRQIDGLFAHQTKRVDALQADADRLSRVVAEAERRIGGGSDARLEPSPFDAGGPAAQAQAFFATLAAAMADSKVKAPQRIVLAIDHLDAMAPERATALLDALHRAAVPGLVTLVGIDPARFRKGGGRSDDLERWIQVPFRLDAATSQATREELVRSALGHGETSFAPAKLDPRRSDLDAPIEDEEAAMLAALSALAGQTPRAVKRFANLYVLARLGEERHLGALAFMLALAQGATKTEQAAVAEALAGDVAARFELPVTERRLRAALDAAVATSGRFTKGDAVEAARRAAAFSLAPSGLA